MTNQEFTKTQQTKVKTGTYIQLNNDAFLVTGKKVFRNIQCHILYNDFNERNILIGCHELRQLLKDGSAIILE